MESLPELLNESDNSITCIICLSTPMIVCKSRGGSQTMGSDCATQITKCPLRGNSLTNFNFKSLKSTPLRINFDPVQQSKLDSEAFKCNTCEKSISPKKFISHRYRCSILNGLIPDVIFAKEIHPGLLHMQKATDDACNVWRCNDCGLEFGSELLSKSLKSSLSDSKNLKPKHKSKTKINSQNDDVNIVKDTDNIYYIPEELKTTKKVYKHPTHGGFLIQMTIEEAEEYDVVKGAFDCISMGKSEKVKEFYVGLRGKIGIGKCCFDIDPSVYIISSLFHPHLVSYHIFGKFMNWGCDLNLEVGSKSSMYRNGDKTISIRCSKCNFDVCKDCIDSTPV